MTQVYASQGCGQDNVRGRVEIIFRKEMWIILRKEIHRSLPQTTACITFQSALKLCLLQEVKL